MSNRTTGFMIDIETTGLDIYRDEIIQIAILELTWVPNFWIPGRAFNTFLHTDREPENDFAKEHMKRIYAQANAAAPMQVGDVAAAIRQFFAASVGDAPAPLIGWCATTFDLPFLERKGYLMRRDYHYRVYEMSGAISLAENALGIERGDLIKQAEAAGSSALIEGQQHDALFDCYKQAKILNGLIALLASKAPAEKRAGG